MPEAPEPKARPHPWKANRPEEGESPGFAGPSSLRAASSSCYAELQVTSNFTFLTGASHPDEFVQQAAALGHSAIAITDKNSLAGIVRAHIAAKEIGIPLAVGCRLEVNRQGHEVPSCLIPSALSILIYPTNRAAYGRLCRLLTLGKRRAPKGECHLTLHDLVDHHEGLLAVVVPPATLDQDFIEVLLGLKRHFDDDRLSLASSCVYGPDDRDRLKQLIMLSEHVNVPLAATNDAHYHAPSRRALQDVLTCIKHGCTIDQAGFRLFPNAERRLKSPAVMARLFAEHPQAVRRSVEVALRAAKFSLDELRYEYPDEVVPLGCTPMQHLINLTWQGAAKHYPQGVPPKVKGQIEHEFKLIDELQYAPYFLTVHDLVVFARSRGILCQGRGAAANSAICFCLGVTAVDPDRIDMLFERFVSKERNEPPDIDIDFEHERREEVIQYIYGKYGRDRAALTAEVITYRGRSAVREVGKALGLSLDCVDRLAKSVDWWLNDIADPNRLREMGMNPRDPTIIRLVALAGELLGFPRHLSQHVGGFVMTRGPLCECVPIENAAMPDRTVIEWDKDDIDALGMLKVDVLGLGMLTCIRKALEFLNQGRIPHEPQRTQRAQRNNLELAETHNHVQIIPPPFQGGGKGVGRAHEQPLTSENQSAHSPSGIGRFNSQHNLALAALYDPQGQRHDRRPKNTLTIDRGPQLNEPLLQWPLQLHTIPPEDPAVYDMICDADTIGVFQIESRAQMSMLPRLRPRSFYDLVIEVAIVRPGPIQGDMVHPYLRRRNRQEDVTYPDEKVKAVLAKTLGVPLFQEQAMSLAIVAAGFTPGEADQLRRAIAAWKTKGNQIAQFGERLMNGMIERGYDAAFAKRCFEQIKGFSGYGFPESHAASFALLVYVSAWIKKHFPAAFAAALLNSQPMGFYQPAQIVRDAREHGVTARPVDVNCSQWDCTLEQESLRLGMRLVRGLREEEAKKISQAVRDHGPFRSVESLWRAGGVRVVSLRRLAAADAFGSMGLDRQAALWQVRALRDESLPMFDQRETLSIDNSELRTQNSELSSLPFVTPLRKVIHDYTSIGLSLRAHPVSFIRQKLLERGVTPAIELKDELRWKHGRSIIVAGAVLVRQRPSTANGIVFFTLEDETGIANLIVRPDVYKRCRKAARHGVIVLARGRVERQGQVVHVLAQHIEDVSLETENLPSHSRDFH